MGHTFHQRNILPPRSHIPTTTLPPYVLQLPLSIGDHNLVIKARRGARDSLETLYPRKGSSWLQSACGE